MNKEMAAAFTDELEKLGISGEAVARAIATRAMKYAPSAKWFKPGELKVLPALMEGEHAQLADVMTRHELKDVVKFTQSVMPKIRPKEELVSRAMKHPGMPKMMETTNSILERMNPKQLDTYLTTKDVQSKLVNKAQLRRWLSTLTPGKRKQFFSEWKQMHQDPTLKQVRRENLEDIASRYPKGMRWKDVKKEIGNQVEGLLGGLVEPEDPADWWKKGSAMNAQIAAAFVDELEKLSMQPYAPKRELAPNAVPGGAVQTSSEEQKPKKRSNLIALFADDAMMAIKKMLPSRVEPL